MKQPAVAISTKRMIKFKIGQPTQAAPSYLRRDTLQAVNNLSALKICRSEAL